MAQRPEDFNLPLTAIRKILQDSMPVGVGVSDKAKLALSKAASVFILYLTTAANAFSEDNKRKRVLGKDVLEAVNDLDFAFLVPPLSVSLTEFHNGPSPKKQTKEDERKEINSGENTPQEIIVLDSSDEEDAAVNSTNSESSSDGDNNDDDDEITIL